MPQVAIMGIPSEDEEELMAALSETAAATIDDMPKSDRRDPDEAGEAVRVAVRRRLREETGKRPTVQVTVLPVD